MRKVSGDVSKGFALHVNDISKRGTEEAKYEEVFTQEKKLGKDFFNSHINEDAFFDELDEDMIDEGVTTGNMSSFYLKK